MLLPLFVTISLFCKVADVIAIVCGGWKNHKMFIDAVRRCYCHGSRWNNHPGWVVFGRCNSHGGRWNYHWSALFQL